MAQRDGQIHLYSLADGRKFRELYLSADGMSDKERNMVNGFEFSDGRFVRFETPFGYIDRSNVLHIYIPDYQGNIVGVINTSSGTLEQFTDYYPYGMPHTDAIGADKSRRKFVSKELTTEYGIDLYDFEQRFLNLDIPCFMSPDRLAYETPHITPYSYCHGDPINYIDPTGLFKTFSETLFYTSFYIGAKVLWDYERSEWFLSLNETGSAAYRSGDTVTKFFGPSSGGGRGGYHLANTIDRMRRVGTGISAFSVSNGLKENLIVWSVRTGPLKGVPRAEMLSDVQAVTKGMGKAVGHYFKVVKGVGYVSALAAAANSGIAMYYYIRGGGRDWTVYAKCSLDIVMAATGCLGLPGYLISTGYFIIDTVSGGLFCTTESLPTMQ